MTRKRILTGLLVTGACLTFASAASAQATRTWVSGVGDDANPCSRTAPCLTFAGAISKTAPGGEINAIDPGAFGSVTITKSITISGAGFTAGVINPGSNGVVVNAGVNDTVILRGLDIHGSTGAFCGYGGASGVRVLSAGNVRIENTTIARQNKAIDITPSAAAINVLVNRVEIADSCAAGVNVAPTGAGSAKLTIRDSSIVNSSTGLAVAHGGTAWLTRSLFSANALALQATGTGAINDYGDNRFTANTADGTPTTDLSVEAPTGPAGPTGSTGATGPVGPIGATGAKGEPAVKLLLANPGATLRARTGRTVAVRYGSTGAASTTLTVSRNGKRVLAVKTSTKAGANRLNLATKRLDAGKYTLTLRATGDDGQTATTKVALRLR